MYARIPCDTLFVHEVIITFPFGSYTYTHEGISYAESSLEVSTRHRQRRRLQVIYFKFQHVIAILHLWSAMLQQQVNHINLHSPHVILLSIVCSSSAQKQQ